VSESERLRQLPAVHEAAARLAAVGAGRGMPRQVVVEEVRRALDAARADIRRGTEPGDAEQRARQAL
jgi:hypothetical protein